MRYSMVTSIRSSASPAGTASTASTMTRGSPSSSARSTSSREPVADVRRCAARTRSGRRRRRASAASRAAAHAGAQQDHASPPRRARTPSYVASTAAGASVGQVPARRERPAAPDLRVVAVRSSDHHRRAPTATEAPHAHESPGAQRRAALDHHGRRPGDERASTGRCGGRRDHAGVHVAEHRRRHARRSARWPRRGRRPCRRARWCRQPVLRPASSSSSSVDVDEGALEAQRRRTP